MSLLKKLAKVAGGAIGFAVGGPTGAKIGAGLGTAAGSLLGSKKSKQAGNTSAAGYQAAADQYRNALADARGYMNPYTTAGTEGVSALNRLNAGDYSGFNSSPDYQYALQQGLQGVEGSAAARGGLYSGNAMRALQQTGSGLASQNLNNYRNALMGQIGVGQNAAGTLTNASFNAAGGIAQGLTGAGDARASGIVGSSNAIQNGISELGALAGSYAGNALVKLKKPKVALNYTNKTAGLA